MFERQRRTKILATLGPATDPPGVLEDLFRAGVNVVRLNFSHGDPSGQAKRAAEVRAAAARVGVEVGILADLPGPKIRIERFAEGKVQLKAGNRFDLIASTSAGPGDATQVGVSYLGLPQDVGPGDVLLLDDGLMQLQVVEVQGERIINTVLNDGVLSDRKGLNKQGGGLSLGALTERDKELIGIVAKIGVDFIAVSFCRNAQDMNDAREIARSHGCDAALVSKIERTEAIENLEEIVEASDVVMVARGDLGVEIGDAELPGLQKKIIKASLAQNKVVITATQMLQSMVESPIPTRAEVLDVANSVIDGTDAVMLGRDRCRCLAGQGGGSDGAHLPGCRAPVPDRDRLQRLAAQPGTCRPGHCHGHHVPVAARGRARDRGDDRIRWHRPLPVAFPRQGAGVRGHPPRRCTPPDGADARCLPDQLRQPWPDPA